MADKFTIDDIMRELELAKSKSATLADKQSEQQNPIVSDFTRQMDAVMKDFPTHGDTQTKTIPARPVTTKTAPGQDTIQFEQIRQDKVGAFLKDFSFKKETAPLNDAEEMINTLNTGHSEMNLAHNWNLDDLDDVVILQDDPDEEEEKPDKKRSFFKRRGRREEEPVLPKVSEPEVDPDEYTCPADADKVNDLLAKQRTFSLIRLGISTVSFVLLLYFAVANFVAIPLPPFMFPESDMRTFLMVNLAVLLISILSSASAIGNGLINLFTLKADGDSATALAAIAVFGHGISLVVNPDFISYGQGHFYFVAATLILMFAAIGSYFQINRIIENFGVVSAGSQKRVLVTVEEAEKAEAIVSPQSIEEPKVVYGTSTIFPKGFMEASFSEGEGITRFIIPLCLLLAIAISFASYFIFRASAMSSFTYFTAMLVVSCPLSITLIYSLPLYRAAKLLAPKGGCILGEEAVNTTEEATAILLTGGDLYYGKNAPVYGIKPFTTDALNQSITDMASIAFALNMPAKQSLLNIVNNDISMLKELDSYQIVPAKGVVAYIEGRRVLMGNCDLMHMFGLSVPGADYEAKLRGNKKELLYISAGDRIAAVFVVGYSAPSTVARALARMERYGVGLCINSADPNITPQRIAQDFGYNVSYINLVDASASSYCEELYQTDNNKSSGVILPSQPAMLLRCFNACYSIKRSINLATIIQIVGLIFGYGAVSFLAFTGAMSNLSFINVVIFQIVTAMAATVALLSSKT